jgi:tetratricopeptide (TPR) repeat protein
MYFDNLANPTDSLKLGEITTNLLITDLSESEYVQVVSSQRLYDILKQLGHEGEKRIDRSVASQVGEKAGAKWMLFGSILNTEPDIVISAQIVGVATGDVLASQRIKGQPNERIFSVIDQLSSAIKEDLSLPPEAASEEDPFVAEMTTDSPEAYRLYVEGLELFYKHLWSDAEILFHKAINIDSTFAMVHFQLAVIDYWRNDPQAHEHIARALKHADGATHKGRLYINSLDARLKRDIPKSIEYLEKLIEEYPEDKNPYTSLGLLLKYEKKQIKEAVPYFERAVELDPFHREAYNQLAYAYNDLGRFDKAMWAINKYIEIAPDEANAFDSRGEILSMNGKLDDAIASYEQSTRLDPEFSRYRLANLYIYRGNFAKADSLIRAMVSNASGRDRAEGRLALTRIPRYHGKFVEALKLLKVGIATDQMELGDATEIAEKLFMRALIYDFLGKPQFAIKDLRQAITISEQHEVRTLYTGLFKAYLAAELTASGNRLAADSVMSDITETIMASGYPDSSFYWMASGFAQYKLHHYETAAEIWNKILSTAPHYFPALMYLGKSYLGNGQLGNAVTALEKANKILDATRGGTPDMGVLCYYYLGRAYEESGWKDKAIEQYETFLDIWKNADPGIKEISDADNRLARLKRNLQG